MQYLFDVKINISVGQMKNLHYIERSLKIVVSLLVKKKQKKKKKTTTTTTKKKTKQKKQKQQQQQQQKKKNPDGIASHVFPNTVETNFQNMSSESSMMQPA